ncbi:MAG: FKBP-type peptidyl-prolyl cis-trans isomerase [Deltaproteobacteria bacterium]|nr:FKBP-type peptidyl-prolyl cis-trans isomerase [Deltaproteobacteria bacterium]
MRPTWMVVIGLGLLAAQVCAGEPQVLTTQKEKMSYSIGVETARNLRQQEIEVDLAILIQGLKDGMSGGKYLMTDEDLLKNRNVILNEQMRKQASQKQKQVQAKKMVAEDNKKAGEIFLAANRTKDGVVALPSGLQYKILKPGDGRKPVDADTVEVHYRGTLIGGKEFDSSHARGKPASFRVKGVIPGWTEALKLMPVGSKWQLFIPPGLAYGEKGAGSLIGPNATLVFEVELLAVK